MPSPAKIRWSQLKVGIMAIAALSILAVLVWLMSGSKGLFKSQSPVYTYMDAANVADGAPVTLNGINVGKVAHAELSGSSEPNKVVRITLLINDDSLPAIPVDSLASLTSANLLGTKFINIKKGTRPETIKSGGELKALDVREFEDLVQQAYPALESLQAITSKVEGIVGQVEAGHGTIGKLLVDETLYNNLMKIVNEANQLATTLNSDQGTLGKLLRDPSMHDNIQATISDADKLINNLNQSLTEPQGTVGKLLNDPSLFDETKKAVGDVRDLLAGLNRGEGTAGKLLKSDELHTQIQSSISRLNALLDKISNGDGAVSRLLNNPQLYEDLDNTTREIQGLLKDFRANPKKFLTIQLKLF